MQAQETSYRSKRRALGERKAKVTHLGRGKKSRKRKAPACSQEGECLEVTVLNLGPTFLLLSLRYGDLANLFSSGLPHSGPFNH